MTEAKKGLLKTIFGGKPKGCCCNMQIIEESDPKEKKPEEAEQPCDSGEKTEE